MVYFESVLSNISIKLYCVYRDFTISGYTIHHSVKCIYSTFKINRWNNYNYLFIFLHIKLTFFEFKSKTRPLKP